MKSAEILDVWFWQRIISPHMAGLAVALASRNVSVTYVSEIAMSQDRARQGWIRPDVSSVHLLMADSDEAAVRIVDSASRNSIHICQGVRANGRVGFVQRALAKRGLRQIIVMETVDDYGWWGSLKRFEYARLFWLRKQHIYAVLATGHATESWVVARGIPSGRVFPFAYFLSDRRLSFDVDCEQETVFRFLFVGRIIALKRLDLLVAALAKLRSRNFEVMIIGSGPEENALRRKCESVLPGLVRWRGQIPSSHVPEAMARADCLVLPSRAEGWGAVVSEALMVGTPVICSDICGSAEAVRASSVGGVFPSGDICALSSLLEKSLNRGKIALDERNRVSSWARCLGAEAGAEYLIHILNHLDGCATRPSPTWLS